MTCIVPIYVARGTRWTITFNFYTDLKTKTPANITGHQYRFLLFNNENCDGDPLADVGSNGDPSPEGSSLTVNGTAGTVVVIVPRETTNFPPDTYFYNLKDLPPGTSPPDEQLPLKGDFVVGSGSTERV